MGDTKVSVGYTAGPWVALKSQSEFGSWGVYTEALNYNVLDASAPGVNSEANARLIAAAPCLVAALEAVDKLSCNCPCMSLEAQRQFERCGEADKYKAELAGVIIAMREAARAALGKARDVE